MKRSQADKAAAFRELHEGTTFIVPNPWDAGSAKVFAALGFEALATTSSALAFTLGRHDGEIELDELIAHVTVVAAATQLPLSVDLENGFGREPSAAAEAIARAAEAGAVGGSIEDFDPAGEIYPRELACERIAAARESADGLDFEFTLTGRAENLIRGNPDLDDTIARLRAYEAAGADVLYAPGLRNSEQIRAVCDAVSKPVNVLAHAGLSVGEIGAAGARRISVGGGLAWVAIGAMAEAAMQMQTSGDLSALGRRVPIDEWLDASG